MQSVIMVSVGILYIVMLSVVMLSVVTPNIGQYSWVSSYSTHKYKARTNTAAYFRHRW
jgi:hypothetical protein